MFKSSVRGGFYISDEIDIFRMYLDKINKEDRIPPYVVVNYQKYFEEIYNIQRIIIFCRTKKRYEDYLKKYEDLLKYIANNYVDLFDYLKKMGDLTSNWNSLLRLFSSSGIFNQLSCPVITAYEYDELYYLVHIFVIL